MLVDGVHGKLHPLICGCITLMDWGNFDEPEPVCQRKAYNLKLGSISINSTSCCWPSSRDTIAIMRTRERNLLYCNLLQLESSQLL